MVSLEALKLYRIQEADLEKTEENSWLINELGHQDWNLVKNWNNVLNNLRLLTQPLLIFHLIKP